MWKDVVVFNEKGEAELKDVHEGKVEMKKVKEKKYLGEVITEDNKNDRNITDKTNKANGNVTKVINTLQERPFGRHKYRAAKVMRDGMIVSSMLSSAESWTNILESDIEKLSKPDKVFLNKLLAEKGNPSTTFMYLKWV